MGRGGKQIRFKMMLELPMSETFAGGRRREGRGKYRRKIGEWWENKVKISPQILSKWEKGIQSWRGGRGRGGRKGRKKIGTSKCYQSYLLKGNGHGITQGDRVRP